MDPSVILAVFPVIFIGELPDKTMFASLVLASRGRPRAVWAGAALAFALHVVIAVTAGVALFRLLPHRAVDAIVALLFATGAAFAVHEARRPVDEAAVVDHVAATHRRTASTAFVVIFLAEWGDLTQILTANLAAHYHAAFSVAIGATLALWAVAALAVAAGTGLMRHINIRVVRLVTAAVLGILALYSAWTALTG